MALSFRRFSWLWFKDRGDKHQLSDNSPKPLTEWAETLRIPSEKRGSRISCSSTNTKGKWRARGDRNKRIDQEYSSDGVGYESDGSDWSIGWLEPHAPDFTSGDDDKADNSFAVLVPCYRHRGRQVEFFSAAKILPSDVSFGAECHMERWLTSHQ